MSHQHIIGHMGMGGRRWSVCTGCK